MEVIDIMPKTQGSGPDGTQELLSLGKPILAALNLTPIGRGITAAVATMATIPEESEAGIFKMMSQRLSQNALTDRGLAIFPDLTRNLEFPTNSFAGYLFKGGSMKNIQSRLVVPDMSNLRAQDVAKVQGALQRMANTPVYEATDRAMQVKHKTNDTTSGFYSNPGNPNKTGKIVIRDSNPIFDQAATIAHEFTHGLDVEDPVMRSIMWAKDKDLDYMYNLAENRAFIAGNRSNMDETLTNVDSADFFHPMLGYANGKVSMAPAVDFVNNMRRSYKAVGRNVYDTQIDEYFDLLRSEALRTQMRVQTNPVYRAKLDEATITTNYNNAQWNINATQGKALLEQQQDFIRTKDPMDIQNANKYNTIIKNLRTIQAKRQGIDISQVSDNDIL